VGCDTQRQIAENEAILRNVNEAIERGHWPGEEASPVAFRCECAELGCSRMIELSVSEYERIRANPRWFVIAAEHECLAAPEVVVESHGHYRIVEKREAAGRAAEASDPRG
jgi:hypothetical protein